MPRLLASGAGRGVGPLHAATGRAVKWDVKGAGDGLRPLSQGEPLRA
ncbi:Hypothetical protein AA314_04433 [Archangium gephyra]|uniref:Uncharacterized protein n=1 Tax=Archangium gephyra TaxID=48 RepID=A0AAC8TEB7_9BACT|nr:Hypothetical protein AA314_04433 [Archangium gephyra]